VGSEEPAWGDDPRLSHTTRRAIDDAFAEARSADPGTQQDVRPHAVREQEPSMKRTVNLLKVRKRTIRMTIVAARIVQPDPD
jgi:hypothetical protein